MDGGFARVAEGSQVVAVALDELELGVHSLQSGLALGEALLEIEHLHFQPIDSIFGLFDPLRLLFLSDFGEDCHLIFVGRSPEPRGC